MKYKNILVSTVVDGDRYEGLYLNGELKLSGVELLDNAEAVESLTFFIKEESLNIENLILLDCDNNFENFIKNHLGYPAHISSVKFDNISNKIFNSVHHIS